MLLTDHTGRLLMVDSAATGVAPPTGHVFDEHGPGDDFAHAYLKAARATIGGEPGAAVTSMQLVVDRWAENRCARVSPDDRIGHHWRVFRATVVDELAGDQRDGHGGRWLSPLVVQALADRTLRWVDGHLADAEFQRSPGLDPIWVWWLALLKVIIVNDPELLRVLEVARR